MKSILIYFALLINISFVLSPECGDGKVYANKDQVKNDLRFGEYPTIKGIPEYKYGSKKLEKLIRSKLVLSEDARSQIFNLNYIFTVTCDGKITNVKVLGLPRMREWTNIEEIIKGTEGSWTPAMHKKKTVDCIYFDKLFINGRKY